MKWEDLLQHVCVCIVYIKKLVVPAEWLHWLELAFLVNCLLDTLGS